jgi:hypothetical protein
MISRTLAYTLAATAMFATAPAVEAQQAGDGWQQTVFLYGMGVSIDGEAQIGNLTVPVDISISDLFDALKFGGMAAYRIDNGEWSFTGDLTYVNLGWSETTQAGRASAGVDVEQLTLMGSVGRRITPYVEGLFSLAYFDLSSDLRVRLLEQRRSASRSASWIDPLIGVNIVVPFADKWSYTLRGDVGGFGVGSDFTWHMITTFRRQNTEKFGWYVGYRVIAYDYEDGKGQNYQRYDLTQQGPGIGVSFSF